MPASDPDRPRRPRKHDDPTRILNPCERSTEPQSSSEGEQRTFGPIDELVDPQDPPDPSEASDPETVPNAKASD
jgi:hypothetical protein